MPVRLIMPSAGREKSISSMSRTGAPAVASRRSASTPLHIGLINNMPDGALEATERQFIALLEQASAGIPIDLSFYSLTGVSRAGEAEARIRACYSSTDTLWNSGLDALIVTGREPLAPSLPEEPYWESFASVVDWARENTCATIWSCLAAHAAVLYEDGIQRVKSQRKYCGIFNCAPESGHPLMAGLASRIKVPHSRWNGVSEDALSAHGYRVLTRSSEAGVDTFVKQDRSLFLYCQGHPEYESTTLLLEYRRDVARYLRGESTSYPTLPENYFSSQKEIELLAFQQRAEAESGSELAGDLSAILATARIGGSWHATAASMYRNLLQYICEQKSRASFGANLVLPSDQTGQVTGNAEGSLDHLQTVTLT